MRNCARHSKLEPHGRRNRLRIDIQSSEMVRSATLFAQVPNLGPAGVPEALLGGAWGGQSTPEIFMIATTMI
eukprot:11614543-Alexandrium_andersonii.AAC.1